MPSPDPSHLIDDSSLVRAAFEAAPDPLVVVDRVGNVVLVNEQAERLFGYSNEEFLQRHLGELMPERFRMHHADYHARYCDSPRLRPMATGLEITAIKSDGTEFPVEIALSPIHTALPAHELTAASIRVVDPHAARADRVHDLERREREVEQLIAAATRQMTLALYDSAEYHRALAHYTQLVRHRVANPLHVIQGMARTLLDMPDLDPDVRRDMLEAIADAATRLAHESIFKPDLRGPEELGLRPRPFE